MKKNFKIDEKVRVHSTNSAELDGQVCTILGRNFVHVVDAYIILLERPCMDASGMLNRAISLIEGNLESIGDS